MLSLLLLLQSSVGSAVVEGKGSPTADIPRLEATAQIDGKFDEPVWSQATRLTGFWQYQPVDGRPAEEETEVMVWYAPDAIYFGIIAHDRSPEAIRATIADRDNIDNDDHVVIDIDTFHDRRRAFYFGVNPLGAQSDGVRSEGAGQVSSLIPGSTDKSPDPGHRRLPGVRQLARDRWGVQLVATPADDRWVLREAGVSSTMRTGARDPRGHAL